MKSITLVYPELLLNMSGTSKSPKSARDREKKAECGGKEEAALEKLLSSM